MLHFCLFYNSFLLILLGGQAKTLMFVQINPDEDSYAETVSTLKFAERVSGVELGAARSYKEGREVRQLMEQVLIIFHLEFKHHIGPSRNDSRKSKINKTHFDTNLYSGSPHCESKLINDEDLFVF